MLVKRIVNLVPHDITIYDNTKSFVKYVYKSVGEARVASDYEQAGMALGIVIRKVITSRIIGLPEPVDGTLYIVSSVVASTLDGSREDVVSPDTILTKVTDTTGRKVVGVCGLIARGDATYEAATLTSFLSLYRDTPVCKKGLSFSELNPLYLYYKAVAEAGGSWPTKEEMCEWDIVTLDEVVNLLIEKDKIYRDEGSSSQNNKADNYIYSHAEVAIRSGRYFIVKSFHI